MTDPASVLDSVPKYSCTIGLGWPELPPTTFESYPFENHNRVFRKQLRLELAGEYHESSTDHIRQHLHFDGDCRGTRSNLQP